MVENLMTHHGLNNFNPSKMKLVLENWTPGGWAHYLEGTKITIRSVRSIP